MKRAVDQDHRSRDEVSPERRRLCGALACLPALSACKPEPRYIRLDLVTFSYWNRPIFDVFINGEGGDDAPAYPATNDSPMFSLPLVLGPQYVTFRLGGQEGMQRYGATVIAKNVPRLIDVEPTARFLGLHVYPDATVELIPTLDFPRQTAKGKVLAAGAGHR